MYVRLAVLVQGGWNADEDAVHVFSCVKSVVGVNFITSASALCPMFPSGDISMCLM